jgi:RimJ/RimL family protein N-acetyltransferase
MPPPLVVTNPIHTERLVLRPFEPGDLDALADMTSLPEVARYLYWEPRSRAEATASLQKKMAATRIEREGEILSLAVTPLSGGSPVGDLTLVYSSAVHAQAEIGYIFHPAVHGRGWATEAVRALVDLAFDGLGVHRVFGQIDGRNAASGAVLERLGLRREAHLVENEWVKGTWTDEVIYAVLAREWRASRLGSS